MKFFSPPSRIAAGMATKNAPAVKSNAPLFASSAPLRIGRPGENFPKDAAPPVQSLK